MAKSHPDSRYLDGAYRSALMDMGAGLDELYLAGTASARGILRQAAEEKLQGDKKARLVNDKGDTLLNILDAFVVILLMASMIPAVALGDLSGIDFAVYFWYYRPFCLNFACYQKLCVRYSAVIGQLVPFCLPGNNRQMGGNGSN